MAGAAERTVQERVDLVEEALVYFCGMCTSICKEVHKPNELEDLISVVRLELWKLSETYEEDKNTHFGKASYVRVRGAIIDYFRKHGNRNRYTKEWRVRVPLTNRLAGPEKLQTMNGLLFGWEKVLDEKAAEVLRLEFFEGLRYAEIARQLEVTVRTVTVRRVRGISRLTHRLRRNR